MPERAFDPGSDAGDGHAKVRFAMRPEAVDVSSVMLTGIFVLLLLFALDFAATLLIPITLAFLLSMLLAPLVRSLGRLRLPPFAAAGVVILTLLSTTGAALYALSAPAERWFRELPLELQRIEYKLRRLKQPIEELQKATQKVEEATAIEDGEPPTMKLQARGAGDVFLATTPAAMAGLGMTIILTFYLLANGEELQRRLVQAIPRFSDKKRAVLLVRQIQQQISRYLFSISLVNLGLGGVTALALWALGLPNPLLWGLMAGLLNYAPYLGALVSVFILLVVGLLSFESTWHALSAPATFLLLTVIEGQFVTPAVVGRQLALHPLAVLLSLIVWGWIWGVAGVLMAVPLLVCFRVMCEHLEPMHRLVPFLSRDPRQDAAEKAPA